MHMVHGIPYFHMPRLDRAHTCESIREYCSLYPGMRLPLLIKSSAIWTPGMTAVVLNSPERLATSEIVRGTRRSSALTLLGYVGPKLLAVRYDTPSHVR